jgi:hypothetical protein
LTQHMTSATDAPPDATTPTIEAITARLAAITPPPWILLPPLCGPDGQAIYNEDGGCICEVGDPYPRGDNHPQENMEFIAHAPADIAALLALVDAADMLAWTSSEVLSLYENDDDSSVGSYVLKHYRDMTAALEAYRAARGRKALEEG